VFILILLTIAKFIECQDILALKKYSYCTYCLDYYKYGVYFNSIILNFKFNKRFHVNLTFTVKQITFHDPVTSRWLFCYFNFDCKLNRFLNNADTRNNLYSERKYASDSEQFCSQNQDNTFYALKRKPGMFYIQPFCGPDFFGKKIIYPRVFLLCNLKAVHQLIWHWHLRSVLSQKNLPAADNQLFNYQPATQLIIVSSWNSIIVCPRPTTTWLWLVGQHAAPQPVKNQMWNLIAV